MNDIRIALRKLRKSPAFAVTVILTIALGIGANTAIFTLVDAILLKSLPVADPRTLYRIGDSDNCCVNGGFVSEDGDFDLFSYELYRHLRDTTPEFETLAAMQSGHETMTVRRGSEPAKSLDGELVSGNYFSTFGVGPYLGRVLVPSDDQPGAAPAVVLSYRAWQSEYGADPSIVGSTIYLQTQPMTVVGVAAPGFFGDRLRQSPPAIFMPIAVEPLLHQGKSLLPLKATNWLYAVGRLKPGTEIGPLQAKISNNLRVFLSGVTNYTENGGSSIIPKQHVVITPAGSGIQNMQQYTRKGLLLLMTISGLVLLVACANIANLLLARGTIRRTETSIRMALGAARPRLIRQMLTESILLAVLGGAAGVFVAYAGAKLILSLAFPDARYLPINASPSLPVLGFAFLLSLATGIVFGIVPAWITSHADPAEALRGANRATRDRGALPQKGLIVFQAALSLVMLVSAGLLTRTLSNLEHQNFGLQTTNRYVIHIDPAGAGYTPETTTQLYERMEQQFSALPGIRNVGLALYSTLEGNNWGECVRVEGKPEPGPNDHCGSSWDRVNSQFFESVGQPVIRGRGFKTSDTATSQFVAVVNQAFVKKFLPNEDPIGRHFGIFDHKYAGAFEIVGVVADAKYNDPRGEIRPMYFRPLTQRMQVTGGSEKMAEDSSLFINSITLNFANPPQNIDSLVRRTLADIDPNLTIIEIQSLDYQVAGNFNQERLIARLTTLFGVLALVLAAVGLYGITSYAVARRTSEIGLRMALGADRGSVIRMVMRGAFAQVALGLVIGIPVALLGARYMADQLYGVRAWDPISLGTAIVILSLAASVAGFLPARRAASTEPMKALRTE